VYSPLELSVPADGLMVQVTAVFDVYWTVAVNCRVCKAARLALDGVTVTLTGIRYAAAVPELLGLATLVARMVTHWALGIKAGAVYRPFELTLPVPTDGSRLQVTAVFVLPVTVGVNCWVCKAARLSAPGDNITLMNARLVAFDGADVLN